MLQDVTKGAAEIVGTTLDGGNVVAGVLDDVKGVGEVSGAVDDGGVLVKPVVGSRVLDESTGSLREQL